MSQCMFLKTFTQTCIHIFRLMFSNNKKCQKVKLNWRFLKKHPDKQYICDSLQFKKMKRLQ